MATTELVFYQEEDGIVPLTEWFNDLPPKVIQKCQAKLERLEELGHELRRPEADYLRDEIYELRASLPRGSLSYALFLSRTFSGCRLAWAGEGKSGATEGHRSCDETQGQI